MNWYKPILLRQQKVTCTAFRAEPNESEIALYAIQAYGFVLASSGEDKRTTFAELADQIEQIYDCSEPRNAEVVRVLRALHIRNPHEPQSRLQYGFRDMNGNAWCDQWVDSYNHLTDIINHSGDGIKGSLSEQEREFFLDQRHRSYQQYTSIARRSA